MHAHVLAHLQALIDLACPRRESTGVEALTAPILELERSPAVRRSRFARTARRMGGSAETRWILRYAVGRAMAESTGLEVRRTFSAVDVSGAVGAPVGAPLGVMDGPHAPATPLLARGVLVRDTHNRLALGVGIEAWIVGGEIACSNLTPLVAAPSVSRLPYVQEACGRLARAVDLSRPVVLRCGDPELAAALAAGVAASRGRPLRSWRYWLDPDEDGDILPALLLAADLDGADVLVSVEPRCGRSRMQHRFAPELSRRRGPAALFLVHGAKTDPFSLLRQEQVMHLEPLREPASRAFAASIPGTSADAGVSSLLLVEAWLPANRALLPDRLSELPRELLAMCAAEQKDDSEQTPAPEHWEVPAETLASLVVSAETRASLDGIVARARVGERCVALLHGPPGTGKSLAARCCAGSLGRPVLRLEASAIRSKYYGVEEENLAEAFAAVRRRGGVLIIDEVDQWIGRREGSSASTGGFRISECTELLIRLDRFDGIAILTTNRQEVLDPALARRVDVWIPLPCPGAIERMALWAQALGPDVTLAPGELMLLAAVAVTGGDIVATTREVGANAGRGRVRALLAAAMRRAEQARLLG